MEVTTKTSSVRKIQSFFSLVFLAFVFLSSCDVPSEPSATTTVSGQDGLPRQQTEVAAPIKTFFELTSTDEKKFDRSLQTIKNSWQPGSTVMVIEVARFARNRSAFENIMKFLETQTGNQFGKNFDKWYQWIWSQEYEPHPQYAQFKSQLYSNIDPRFREYFTDTDNSKIRLDEIRWGGVVRDGIPPLNKPAMISAENATYLDDSNVVFGVELNGDARCYPKRILARHEMFKDTIGGESVCGVY
jgi:hypothetical protein